MEDKKLTTDESLELISNMIGQAKRNIVRGGSFYFLLWGWVILICNFSHHVLWKYELYDAPHIVWVLTLPAALITFGYSFSKRRKAKVTSHLNSTYTSLWLAVGASIFTVLVFMGKLGYNQNGVILLLSGIGTYVSGAIIRFRPLILGGLFFWLGAIIAFNMPVVDQYLVSAITIIVGYIIPGYMLKRAESE